MNKKKTVSDTRYVLEISLIGYNSRTTTTEVKAVIKGTQLTVYKAYESFCRTLCFEMLAANNIFNQVIEKGYYTNHFPLGSVLITHTER